MYVYLSCTVSCALGLGSGFLGLTGSCLGLGGGISSTTLATGLCLFLKWHTNMHTHTSTIIQSLPAARTSCDHPSLYLDFLERGADLGGCVTSCRLFRCLASLIRCLARLGSASSDLQVIVCRSTLSMPTKELELLPLHSKQQVPSVRPCQCHPSVLTSSVLQPVT